MPKMIHGAVQTQVPQISRTQTINSSKVERMMKILGVVLLKTITKNRLPTKIIMGL